MSAAGTYRFALGLLFAQGLREWGGATLYRVDSSLSQILLRGIDVTYLLFFVLALHRLVRDRAFTRAQRLLGVGLALLVLVSTFVTTEPVLLFRSIREAVLPTGFLVAGAVVGRETGEDPRGRFWRRALLTLLWVGSAVGILQALTVTSMEDYWFNHYATITGEVFDEYNYIRFGRARGTGLGVSPFWLGYLALGLALFGFVRYRIDRTERPIDEADRRELAAALAGALVATLASGSRLAAASLVFVVVAMRWRLSPRVMVIVAVGLAAAFGRGAFEQIEDTSLLGRFDQVQTAVVDQLVGHPFGAPVPTGPTTIWFDSYLLNFIVTFGMPALLVLVGFVATFARGIARRTTVFAIAGVLLVQALLQALEYTVFLPLALFTLGLVHGHATRTLAAPAAAPAPLAVPAEAAR
jgi:hypothetical protein